MLTAQGLAVRNFLAEPESLYEQTPLASALHEAIFEARTRGAHRLTEAQWQGLHEAATRIMRRSDLLMQVAFETVLEAMPPSRRAAAEAELAGVRITGTLESFTMLPNAFRATLSNAQVVVPSTGQTLLSSDDDADARLLILAASADCFPAAATTTAARRQDGATGLHHAGVRRP